MGGRGHVRRAIAQGETKCSGRRALALASELVGARDERDDFLSERVGVAPGDRRRTLLLVLAEPAEEATALDRFLVRLRREELRNRVRLDVAAAVQRSQFFEQVVLVRRREKCREEDDVRKLRTESGNRRVRRIDEKELRVHVLADDPFEDRALAVIRLDGEYQRHVD